MNPIATSPQTGWQQAARPEQAMTKSVRETAATKRHKVKPANSQKDNVAASTGRSLPPPTRSTRHRLRRDARWWVPKSGCGPAQLRLFLANPSSIFPSAAEAARITKKSSQSFQKKLSVRIASILSISSTPGTGETGQRQGPV